MTDLNPLIRVRKYEVEQHQKFVSQLYRQDESLVKQKKDMLDTLADEQEKVQDMGIDMLIYFQNYSTTVKKRVEDIDHARTKLKDRIDAARETVRAAFAELKKVEIVKERREADELSEIEKKENDEMDDIAIQTFNKKQAEHD